MTVLAYVSAGLMVVMLLTMGGAAIYAPPCAFSQLLGTDEDRTSRGWKVATRLLINLGALYWLLAIGLALSMAGWMGGPEGCRYFLLAAAASAILAWNTVGRHRAFAVQCGLAAAGLVFFGGVP